MDHAGHPTCEGPKHLAETAAHGRESQGGHPERQRICPIGIVGQDSDFGSRQQVQAVRNRNLVASQASGTKCAAPNQGSTLRALEVLAEELDDPVECVAESGEIKTFFIVIEEVVVSALIKHPLRMRSNVAGRHHVIDR